MNERTVVQTGFSGTQLLLAVLGGAAVGAAVAYLTAPKSGRETRARLTESLRETRDQLTETLRETRDQLTDVIDDGREKIRAFPIAAKSAGSAARTAFVSAMEDSKS